MSKGRALQTCLTKGGQFIVLQDLGGSDGGVGEENVPGPTSVRINLASGLVVSRRRSRGPISRRNSIPSLISVEEIVPLVGVSGRNSASYQLEE